MGIAERKLREKENRRASILQAAKEVFFAKGLAEGTLDEVAAAAELSKGTLYLYFSSKEELYCSLLVEGTQILREYFERALDPLIDPEANLRRLGQAYFQFSQEQPQFFRLMFLYNFHSEFKQPLPKELKDELDCGGDGCLKMVSDTIEEGIRRGHFRSVSPYLASMACWAALNGTVMLAVNEPHRVGGSLEQIVSLQLDAFLRGLRE
ncbi:MAG TPA: TetR/AcrR family transcriptional regulator [Candidatus Acidoferrales bacterium]